MMTPTPSSSPEPCLQTHLAFLSCSHPFHTGLCDIALTLTKPQHCPVAKWNLKHRLQTPRKGCGHRRGDVIDCPFSALLRGS